MVIYIQKTGIHPSFSNMSAAATLRKLLAREGEIVASPGVYDGVTARLALNAGFDTLYMVTHSTLSPRQVYLTINRPEPVAQCLVLA